jgi:4-hydroxy-tetrahydrodipicolinate synthase
VTSQISGVFAALLTPIDDFGRPDLAAFDRLLDFILERGVDGVVIGGATGEYAHFELDDRVRVARHAAKRLRDRAQVLSCIGASSIHSTLRLARRLQATGNEALLLPMPHFFRYEQEDLKAFCRTVCSLIDERFLLYNLPSFTNRLEVGTAIELLETTPNLIGIKDSSGQKSNLAPLAKARAAANFSLLVGDDSLLLSALRAGWDGVISGIACFAPELVKAVYRSHRDGLSNEAARFQAMLDEIIEWVVRFPIPWAVRIALAARGIPNGPMHIPLSPERSRQISEFRSWFSDWASKQGLALEQVWSFDRRAA